MKSVFFAEVNAHIFDCGRPAASLLHICGNNTLLLERVADTGAQIIELDHKVVLDFAFGKIGDRVCLMGNLDPTGILLLGSRVEVEDNARRAIAIGGKKGRFILGSGCEVPPATPLENIRALVRVAHKTAGKRSHDFTTFSCRSKERLP